MNTIDRLKWRYATKKFNPNIKLSEKKLDTLKQAFNLTATSFGLQTITMVVIENKDFREQLVAHAYNQKQVLEASHLLVICIQNNIESSDVIKYYNNIKDTRSTPETILKPYKQQLIDMLENMSVEQRQQWSSNQAYIALGNLMTVCAIEGIDSCPMEGFNPEKFDELLQLQQKGLKSVLLLPVGYRADNDMFSELKKVRKPLKETVIEM